MIDLWGYFCSGTRYLQTGGGTFQGVEQDSTFLGWNKFALILSNITRSSKLKLNVHSAIKEHRFVYSHVLGDLNFQVRICASKETGGENGTLLSPLPPSSWLSKKGEALVGQVAKNHLERRINTNLRKPAWQRNETKVDVVLILKYILVTKIWCDCKRQNDDEWTILIQRRSYEESQPNLHSRCWCRHSWRRCCHRAQSQEVLGSLGRMIPSRCLAAPARDNQGDFFRRVGIFRTYPRESVSHSVSHTFRFPLCGCLCTVTEQLWATGFDIFSESNE